MSTVQEGRNNLLQFSYITFIYFCLMIIFYLGYRYIIFKRLEKDEDEQSRDGRSTNADAERYAAQLEGYNSSGRFGSIDAFRGLVFSFWNFISHFYLFMQCDYYIDDICQLRSWSVQISAARSMGRSASGRCCLSLFHLHHGRLNCDQLSKFSPANELQPWKNFIENLYSIFQTFSPRLDSQLYWCRY